MPDDDERPTIDGYCAPLDLDAIRARVKAAQTAFPGSSASVSSVSVALPPDVLLELVAEVERLRAALSQTAHEGRG